MNSKAHLIMSLIKSGIRIAACGFVIFNLSNPLVLIFAAFGFAIAEVLGIAEELWDKR